MTRVIVEGPDGAGKTSLIEKLVAQTNIAIAPRASDSVRGPNLDLTAYIEDDLYNHDGEDRIYDRHPLISEPIYGAVIRGYVQFDDRGLGWLTSMFELFYGYAPIIVYCLPPWGAVNENVQRGVHMSGVSVNIRKIYQLYAVEFCRDVAANRRVHCWDYTHPVNLANILRDIEGAPRYG